MTWVLFGRIVAAAFVISDRGFIVGFGVHDPEDIQLSTAGDIRKMLKLCGPRGSSGIRGLVLVLDSDDVTAVLLNRSHKTGHPDDDFSVHHQRRMTLADFQLPAESMFHDKRPWTRA